MKLTSEHIMHVYYKPNTEVTAETVNWVVKNSNEMTDKPVPFVYMGGEFITVTKAGFRQHRKTDHLLPASVVAILVNGLGQKIMADFYYGTIKNPYPIKIFRNRNKACQWIHSFVKRKNLSCA